MNRTEIEAALSPQARIIANQLTNSGDQMPSGGLELVQKAVLGHLLNQDPQEPEALPSQPATLRQRDKRQQNPVYRLALMQTEPTSASLAELGQKLQVRRGDFLRSIDERALLLDVHASADPERRRGFYEALTKRAGEEITIGAIAIDPHLVQVEEMSNLASDLAIGASSLAGQLSLASTELVFVEWRDGEFQQV